MDQKVTKMDQKVTKMDQKDGQKVTGIDPSQPKREKKTFIGPTLGHLRLKKFLTHNTNWHFFFIANFKNAYTRRTQTKKFAKNADTNCKTNFSKKCL